MGQLADSHLGLAAGDEHGLDKPSQLFAAVRTFGLGQVIGAALLRFPDDTPIEKAANSIAGYAVNVGAVTVLLAQAALDVSAIGFGLESEKATESLCDTADEWVGSDGHSPIEDQTGVW